ncbi:class I SAM-dependent methyltransferase [Haliscomenobacter hydrossis]|uniref:Methyltransferase type 11 n=1 Tax=Haliscomenobacter hydrossis (strain ATCC 27775 / DSM 1100 / LMG 10767 / O) TaxID=760192 RepID=F4KTG8_HALH1|nr:class I SAM-dependent methyltransferase [Haliscomenobacter hydrossis]AEE52382.1 Methyltransferase type 11 [Haliscomenobacter hydrossis DSM 1100]
MKTFWDERYSSAEYVYGESPNAFFKAQLEQLTPGTLLLPCEGEGRNAVFAAGKGWLVEAFDQSEAGRTKALQLAERKGLNIHYQIGDWLEMTYPEASFDVIALVFAHLPAALRTAAHQQVIPYLKPGGVLILEGFNKAQLQYQTGGPRDLAMLFSEAELRHDFAALDILELYETEVELDEGVFHQGKAAVIRMVGRRL